MWPHPTPGSQDFHNFESTLPENAFIRFGFPGLTVCEKTISKDLLYIFLRKKRLTSSLWPHPTHGGHDFHNFELTLPENAST